MECNKKYFICDKCGARIDVLDCPRDNFQNWGAYVKKKFF